MVLEAKNGRSARLTRNQRLAFSHVDAGGALMPYGPKAEALGLTNPIGSYRVVHYP